MTMNGKREGMSVSKQIVIPRPMWYDDADGADTKSKNKDTQRTNLAIGRLLVFLALIM